ncbi:MAG: S1C family serine protease [Clostridiales bacterium]|nr:S1C family serine protease [Clostridiales bacterium]
MEIYDHNTLHTEKQPSEPRGQRDTLKIVLVVCCVVLAVALAVVSVCFAFACSRRGDGQEENEQSAYAKVRPSVARIWASSPGMVKAGSGVVYKIRAGETYVITNHHVIEGCTSVELIFGENDVAQEGIVLGYDEYHDIALIKVQGAFGEAVSAALLPDVGTRVLAVGNNLDEGIAAFDGIVSRTDRLLNVGGENGKTVPVCAVTSPINAGMSGGGVFILGGKIVGIGTYQTGRVSENGSDRPVDGVSYCVPYGIAEKIAARIMREESNGQVNKLSVVGDTRIDDGINFEDLFFSMRRLPKGYTVDADSFVSSEMTEGLKDGDIVERFGSLTVTPETPFYAFFEEALRYARGDAYSGNERLKVCVLRGNERITTEFNRVHKTA